MRFAALRRHIALCLLVLSCASRLGASDWVDRVMDWPVIGLPVVSYSNETSWAFGAAAAGFFTLPSDSVRRRTSEANLYGLYTLRKQWQFSANATLYISDRWHLIAKAGFRHYPDHYYGVGNEPDGLFHTSDGRISYESFTSDRYQLFVQPLYAVLPDLHVGPAIDWRYETTGLHAIRYCHLGIGAAVEYDTRERHFYPRRGLFLKVQGYYLPDLIDHDHLGRVQLDFRHFVPIWREHIFAYQLYGEGLYGNAPADKVTQLMPTLGGEDQLRGFYRGMYRDNTLLLAQAEMRFPIWRILRGTVFAGVGDVYDIRHWHWATPKVGYGLGLRLQFNQAGIDIRLDAARNNIESSWADINSYYFNLQVKEAF